MTTQTKFPQVLAVIAAIEERYKARRAAIEAAYTEANNGKEPTRDSQGRYHAPCNGYMLPEGWAVDCPGDYSGHLFGRGEYLPLPITSDDHEQNLWGALQNLPDYDYRHKAKALVSDIAELQSLKIRGMEVGQGKAWMDDSGNLTAYAYISGLKSVAMAAGNDLETLYKASRVNTAPEVYLEGRVNVIGVIVAVKPHIDPMYGESLKMLVTTDEGCRLWGTMPSALSPDAKGKKISFTATFTKGKDGMTYYKRPACAVIVGE